MLRKMKLSLSKKSAGPERGERGAEKVRKGLRK